MIRLEYDDRAPRPRWKSVLGLSGGFLAVLVAAMVAIVLVVVIVWGLWFLGTTLYWLPRG
ncbi:hypothetical protein [Actinoplanes sp. NPDC049316]|uniref:hypothetical protein n=1 Tax=Actinoplanes sp. NPDC049316 TaxID=3154727 RepID=UPI00343436C2